MKAMIIMILSVILFGVFIGEPVDPIIDPVLFLVITLMVYITYTSIQIITLMLRGEIDMSYFSRTLLRSMKSNTKWVESIIERLDNKPHNNFITDSYYKVKCFLINLQWMIPAAWDFRPWDYTYNVQLFADSLEKTSECLIDGHCLHGKRYGRRCLYASKMLKKFYIDDEYYHYDKSYLNLQKNNPSDIEKFQNAGFKLTRKYKISEDYYIKMFKVINNRSKNKEKEQKEYVWKYINKYIHNWWE